MSPILTTMIRYLVSSQASCQFCIDLNEGFLAHLGVNLDRAREARTDPRSAPIDTRDMPLLSLALLAVNAPDQVTDTEMRAARELGWSDRDIFDAVVQATNNRAFNNVLRTFKVEAQGVFA